jgi:hypothetical protein
MPFFVVPETKYEFLHPEGTGEGAGVKDSICQIVMHLSNLLDLEMLRI